MTTMPVDRAVPLPSILDMEILQAQDQLIGTLRSFTTADLRHQCVVFGIVPGNCDSATLTSMIAKLPSQPTVYEGFTLRDVIKFIRARKLEIDEEADKELEECKRLRIDIMQGLSAMSIIEAEMDGREQVIGSSSFRPSTSAGTARDSVDPQNEPWIHWSRFRQLPLLNELVEAHRRLSRAKDRFRSKSPNLMAYLCAVLEQGDRLMTFDMLSLPFEIRTMILRLVCVSSTIIVHPQHQPAISKTCRSLRREALRVYYSHNIFTVAVDRTSSYIPTAYNRWLHVLDASHLAYIRSYAFMYARMGSVIIVHFPIRGQPFKLVRWSSYWSSESSQQKRHYLACSSAEATQRCAKNLLLSVLVERWGLNPESNFPSKFLCLEDTMLTSDMKHYIGKALRYTPLALLESKEHLLADLSPAQGFAALTILKMGEIITRDHSQINRLWSCGE